MVKLKYLVGILLLLGTVSERSAGVGVADLSVGTLRDYFDLVASGNADVAEDLWLASSRERALRFGIEFEGIAIKADCGSPVIRDLKRMRGHLEPAVKQVHELDSVYTRLEFSQLVDGTRVQHYYYIYYDGNYFWLVYPQDFYCKDWPVVETRYFRLHVDPSRRTPNQVALDAADRHVEQVAKALDLSKRNLEKLAESGIEYFLCGTDSLVATITGHSVRGTLDLGSNDVISSAFPSNRDIVQLLINIRFQRLPLYTQPIVREGATVALGGVPGKEPPALMGLGAFLFKEGMVSLDSLLSMRSFDNPASADIAFPVAGLFGSFLLEKVGTESFFALYRQLSGSFQYVYEMTPFEVQQLLLTAAKLATWDQLVSEFGTYADEMVATGLPLLPGTTGEGKARLDLDGVSVTEDGEWLNFEFSFPAGTSPRGNLLMSRLAALDGLQPSYFMMQYQDSVSYPGFRYGLRFDENEAGLYDYAVDQLVAKFVNGLTPSDAYRGHSRNVIAVRLKKHLLEDVSLRPENVLYLDR
jgi:hypothetical protein